MRSSRSSSGYDLALVPDVVAAGDDVHAGVEERMRAVDDREAHAAGQVLAVGGHEVDAALLAQRRDQRRSSATRPGLADDVADHQHAHDAWARRAPAARGSRSAARTCRATRRSSAPISGQGYLAYSTARVSRMTVTLIWPG